ncbi:class I SAM-dependent methyltransferase [Robertkochia sediminum]|uniref:class I SAM-dependent methyltransferase n=1 Tax=Robertkochia sediminum TaxID=2785326 RepID=UPI001931B1D6|nr:class I SAM-dependent methyltransferase [Robertkochia sediminum]MBL7472090.1 class I SAM-dependent methyltransferase [Robertkochia sediminum]
MNKETLNWYKEWFDTDFYHILYRERNLNEAALFMKNLTTYLNLPDNASVLDVGCGRGRHSVMLGEMGYTVRGIDLSESNIEHAKQFTSSRLRFDVHDMSEPYGDHYDAIFNLFTSFGYFDNDHDHIKTLRMMKDALKDNGFGVIDFMNVTEVSSHLIPASKIAFGGINFHIERYEEDGHICKDIRFEHDQTPYHFTERVKAYSLQDFEQMFEEAGIFLLDVFGDYKLNKYHPTRSERLVMIFK